MDDSPRVTMLKGVFRLYVRLIDSLKSHVPETFIYQWRYFRTHGRLCDFKHPRTFSEKIYHRMRYPSPEFSRLADKVLVRDYIRDTVGEAFNVPLYAAVPRATAEVFDALPDTFVMKSNNGCGSIRIVRDKATEDIQALMDLANTWLENDFSSFNGERHYRAIAPQILFEKALLINNRSAADYKVHVFNPADGDAFCFLQIVDDRFGQPTQNLYSSDWLATGFRLGQSLPPSSDPGITLCPAELQQMLDAAKRLAKPFGYCRVDFYVHGGGLYVGELTFTPGAGKFVFYPSQWDWTLGAMFRWPEMSAIGALMPGGSAALPAHREQPVGDQQSA